MSCRLGGIVHESGLDSGLDMTINMWEDVGKVELISGNRISSYAVRRCFYV